MRHTVGFGRSACALECCRSAGAAGTLRSMRIGRVLAVLLVLAAACGGDGGSGPGRGDYFTQLERVSETAHIQEHGLRRDLTARLKQARGGDDRLNAVVVFVDQSARLYRDVVDALRDLDPPQEAEAAHQGYLDAWQGQLDLVVAVRDAGFPGPLPYLEALKAPAFDDAATETRSRCQALQSVVAARDPDADLRCGGRDTG
jgi:hypothetical protein